MANRELNNRYFPEHEFTEALEAPSERKLIQRVMLFIVLAVFSILLWSVFANIEEVAKAKGQVIPLGRKQVIQSQTGGTLASVLVSEGDLVKKGDTIASFVSVDSQAVEEELLGQRANLELKIERYNAFMETRKPNFEAYADLYPSLVDQHLKSLERMNKEYEAIVQLSQSDIEKSTAELRSIDFEIPPLKDQIKSSEQSLKMMNSAKGSQAVSRLTMLETQQKYDSYIRELKNLEGRRGVVEKTIQNLQKQLEQRIATLYKEVGENRTDAHSELIGVTARLKSSNLQIQQDTVVSPVNGIIQSIPNSSSGSVIQPGGTVAVIVPTTATALLEAKLSPRDIGFVRVGQKAKIKIDAYDYSRYGSIDGTVKKISPTTDADEKGGVYYKVQIDIEKPYFGNNPEVLHLLPGMTGEADIVTGEKTIFQYLWKPVFTNIRESFGER